MGLRRHLQQSGYVHAGWTIAVLLAVIAWLLLSRPNGEAIEKYIGFAASVASLMLALVAIGYAYISNQSFNQNVGTLRSSSESLQAAALNISETSATLNKRFEDVATNVATVPAAVAELTAKLDAQAASAKPEVDAPLPLAGGKDGKTADLLDRAHFGTQIGLYVLAKSFISRKTFNSNVIIREADKVFWNSIITGFILGVIDFRDSSISIEITRASDAVYYKVVSLGDLHESLIVSRMAQKDQTGIVPLVDQYFASLPESVPS